jgi:hypothetical protein
MIFIALPAGPVSELPYLASGLWVGTGYVCHLFLFERSLHIFITKIMQLQLQVTAFVITIDQIIFGRCSSPCNIKANAPIAIIRKAGTDIPSVLRVRIVLIACGKNPNISPMLATYPQMVYKIVCSIVVFIS